MKLKNLGLCLGLLGTIVLTGCSSKGDVDNTNKTETLVINSKYMQQNIPTIKKCETTNIEYSNSTKKLKGVNSTLVGGSETISVDYDTIRSGNKSEISYCKVGQDKLEVKLNIDLYNKYEHNDDGDNILVPEYKHNSTIVMERGKPVKFKDFEIVWTYK